MGAPGNWKLIDEVGATGRDSVFICNLWGATIYLQGEKVTCRIGTLFVVNLEKREIRYLSNDAQGLSRRRDERDVERNALSSGLEGKGFKQLEESRKTLIEKREVEQNKVAEESKRSAYLEAFNNSTTLDKIQDFETRYKDDDTDGFIGQLNSRKPGLQYEAYRSAYGNATSISSLEEFIETYKDNDVDKLNQWG